MNEQFWGDMLNVLKDISGYLEKQDATQERAKIDPSPKISENPKPIKGGENPGFKPADKIAKEFVLQDSAMDRVTVDLKGQEDSMLKDEPGEVVEEVNETPSEEYVGEEEKEEIPSEESEEEESEDMEELKSILKDIRSALSKQSNVADVIKSEIKKSMGPAVKSEVDKMLRKTGFVPTRPDIQKIDVTKSLGVDSVDEVKKSEDFKKSKDKESEIVEVLEDMTKKSWSELGRLREKTGGFNPFLR